MAGGLYVGHGARVYGTVELPVEEKKRGADGKGTRNLG